MAPQPFQKSHLEEKNIDFVHVYLNPILAQDMHAELSRTTTLERFPSSYTLDAQLCVSPGPGLK